MLLHIPEDVACIPVVSIIYGGMQNRKIIVGDNRDQKFALRTCFKDWSSQYTDLLEHASLPSLASHPISRLNSAIFSKLYMA